jgi:hypothetical protein
LLARSALAHHLRAEDDPAVVSELRKATTGAAGS